jgi:hypothetical protein
MKGQFCHKFFKILAAFAQGTNLSENFLGIFSGCIKHYSPFFSYSINKRLASSSLREIPASSVQIVNIDVLTGSIFL